MGVNLLAYAPTEGTLFSLEDQPATARAERSAATAINIKWKSTQGPRKFIDNVFEWKREISDEDRPETKLALLIDNRMPEIDIEDLIDSRDELVQAKQRLPRRELLDCDNGARTGLIFVQHVIRNVDDLKDMPVMLLSAFGINRYEGTLRILNEYSTAPTVYVAKATSQYGAGVGNFVRTVAKWIFDRGLYIMHRLAQDLWDMSDGEVCGALALRSGNVEEIGELFDRRRPRRTSDTDQRVNYLRIIHERLAALFRGNAGWEIEWLATPVPVLGGSRPRDLICSGDFTRLSLVRGYVEALAEPWNTLGTQDEHALRAQ